MTTPKGGGGLGKLILVILFFAVATAVMTYPLSIHPATYVRDQYDSLLFAWMLGWMTDAIFAHPLELFQANAFYPFPDSLAFTDAPIAILPIAAPIISVTHNPVLAVNIAILAGFFFSGLGAFVLTRHLTHSVGAGVVAGIIFAFCPYRFAHLCQLQLLTAQWIPLAFFFLHRSLEDRRWRDFFGFAACFVLQALSSLYYGLFLAVGVALFVAYFAVRPPRRPLEFLLKLGAVSVCAGMVMIPYLQPYWRVRKTYGFQRNLDELKNGPTADLQDYLSVPYDNLMGGLGELHIETEHSLFPGLAPIFLAAIGMFIVSTGDQRRRVPKGEAGSLECGHKPWFGLSISRSQGFYLVLAVCAFVLSLGPNLRAFGHETELTLPYLILYKYCPGFDSIRSASRFGALVFLAVAVLAGVGVARIVDGAVLGRASRSLRIVVAGIIALMVMSEYASFPVRLEPIEVGARIPEVYRWLAHEETGTAVVELPLGPIKKSDARYQYFATFHRRPIVNGYSGFYPGLHLEMLNVLTRFPSGDSVGLLRALGVGLVIVHEDGYRPEFFRTLQSQMAENPGLILERSFGKDHVYRVGHRAGGGQSGDSESEAELSSSTRILLSRIRELTRKTPVR